MSHYNAPETYRELLQLLLEFLTEPEDDTPEEVNAYLREAGYNPDDLVTRMRQRMKTAMDASPHNWRNQTGKIQEERNTLDQFTHDLSGTLDQLKAQINTLLNTSRAQLVVHHRNLNLDDMTEADLAQLLGELRFQLSQRRNSSDGDKET